LAADGGTLLLDEIGDMSPEAQAKILRVLQEGEFEPVGSDKTTKVDVRILAATNKDLVKEIEEGRFREDLYYRINPPNIALLPLRERAEDISLLIDHFIEKLPKDLGKENCGILPSARAILTQYDWPGNVRELKNVIVHAMAMTDEEVIRICDIPPNIQNKVMDKKDKEEVERQIILEALERNDWNKSKTAKELNMPRPTLYDKLRKYQISKT
jgi:transcriptional regulator with PAS, ATPase and Fis domain